MECNKMVDNTEVKTISPSILGRNRKKYDTMRQLDGMTEKQVKQTMTLDVKLYNKQNNTAFTLDDYVNMLESLNKKSETGKRDKDKLTRDSLITETQDLLSIVNLAVSVKRGESQLTPKQKAKCFDVLADYGEVLTNHLKTAFSPIGGMTMFWNPSSQAKDGKDGLSVYIGGWEDGSNKPRYQYAPRKCPISKRSGYRDDSFEVSIYSLTETPKQTETQTETSETQS
jgi:AICAR transformylase/IMP cyclohydrolase PurH